MEVGFDILEEAVECITRKRQFCFVQTDGVFTVVLGVGCHLRCIKRTTHRVHLHFQRTLALQSHRGIQHRIVAQHFTCLELDSRRFEFCYKRCGHRKVEFVGCQVNTRPVEFGFGGRGIRDMYRRVGIR